MNFYRNFFPYIVSLLVQQLPQEECLERTGLSSHAGPITITNPYVAGASVGIRRIYNSFGFRVTFRTSRTVHSLLTGSPCMMVYRVHCSRCQAYFAILDQRTQKCLQSRTTGIVSHCWACLEADHPIQWSGTCFVDQVSSLYVNEDCGVELQDC